MKTKKTPTKVAFVGTSCVGKTTLLAELQNALKSRNDVIFVEEQARKYFEENKIKTKRFAIEHQQAIQDMVLEAEKRAHLQAPAIIVCDRSVIDAAVYISNFVSKNDGMASVKRVKHWVPSYSKIYLLDPIDVPYETDSVRREDAADRQKIHEEYIYMLEKSKIPHELLSGTLPERISKVVEFIG